MAASKIKEAAPFDDSRQAGWPWYGTHRAGAVRQNQGSQWQAHPLRDQSQLRASGTLPGPLCKGVRGCGDSARWSWDWKPPAAADAEEAENGESDLLEAPESDNEDLVSQAASDMSTSSFRRRATHAAGVTYFTAFSDRWEINGISEAFANDFGRNLAKKSVVKEVIADLYVKTPGLGVSPRYRCDCEATRLIFVLKLTVEKLERENLDLKVDSMLQKNIVARREKPGDVLDENFEPADIGLDDLPVPEDLLTGKRFAFAGCLIKQITEGRLSQATCPATKEVRRAAAQRLQFPAWGLLWTFVSTIVWADASQGNRPNKSSTVGYVACYGPEQLVKGDEAQLALVGWKTSKSPRGTLGSNGAEVQAITVGKDVCFLLRALWLKLKFKGGKVTRQELESDVRGAKLRWVNRVALADGMTKSGGTLPEREPTGRQGVLARSGCNLQQAHGETPLHAGEVLEIAMALSAVAHALLGPVDMWLLGETLTVFRVGSFVRGQSFASPRSGRGEGGISDAFASPGGEAGADGMLVAAGSLGSGNFEYNDTLKAVRQRLIDAQNENKEFTSHTVGISYMRSSTPWTTGWVPSAKGAAVSLIHMEASKSWLRMVCKPCHGICDTCQQSKLDNYWWAAATCDEFVGACSAKGSEHNACVLMVKPATARPSVPAYADLYIRRLRGEDEDAPASASSASAMEVNSGTCVTGTLPVEVLALQFKLREKDHDLEEVTIPQDAQLIEPSRSYNKMGRTARWGDRVTAPEERDQQPDSTVVSGVSMTGDVGVGWNRRIDFGGFPDDPKRSALPRSTCYVAGAIRRLCPS
ncbi:unnamed protein product [Symbiodinium microadriaticum]|nr:unnamed protein product [Symbiodinium microadriaticum]